jgi:WD40 repeat protein
MSGHDGYVVGVCVADECGAEATGSVVIASCSSDGSIRLWGVDEAGSSDEQGLQVLQCSAQELLCCVAVTPDA